MCLSECPCLNFCDHSSISLDMLRVDGRHGAVGITVLLCFNS